MAIPPHSPFHTPLPNTALFAARLRFGGADAPRATRHRAGPVWAGLCGLVASAVALACVPVAAAAQATPAATIWAEGVPAIDLAAFRADVAGPR
ncbi:MAG: hypothetical protein ACKOUM_03765, partial [Sphingopyxis sp.]